jgi:hypothetical protein
MAVASAGETFRLTKVPCGSFRAWAICSRRTAFSSWTIIPTLSAAGKHRSGLVPSENRVRASKPTCRQFECARYRGNDETQGQDRQAGTTHVEAESASDTATNRPAQVVAHQGPIERRRVWATLARPQPARRRQVHDAATAHPAEGPAAEWIVRVSMDGDQLKQLPPHCRAVAGRGSHRMGGGPQRDRPAVEVSVRQGRSFSPTRLSGGDSVP